MGLYIWDNSFCANAGKENIMHLHIKSVFFGCKLILNHILFYTHLITYI